MARAPSRGPLLKGAWGAAGVAYKQVSEDIAIDAATSPVAGPLASSSVRRVRA
jgi:hypothetical protein